jgi:aspartyl aminopeptidase
MMYSSSSWNKWIVRIIGLVIVVYIGSIIYHCNRERSEKAEQERQDSIDNIYNYVPDSTKTNRNSFLNLCAEYIVEEESEWIRNNLGIELDVDQQNELCEIVEDQIWEYLPEMIEERME